MKGSVKGICLLALKTRTITLNQNNPSHRLRRFIEFQNGSKHFDLQRKHYKHFSQAFEVGKVGMRIEEQIPISRLVEA